MDNISPVKRVRVGELYSWIFHHAMFDYWRVYPFMFHEYFIIALLYHQYEPLLLFPMITIPLYPMNIPLYSYSFPICLQENPAGPGNP